jgi:hypothetical protein
MWIRMRILLLIKVIKIFYYWPSGPPWLQCEPPRLRFEPLRLQGVNPWLHFEPLELLNVDIDADQDPSPYFDFDADPDPVFDFDADQDKTSQK